MHADSMEGALALRSMATPTIVALSAAAAVLTMLMGFGLWVAARRIPKQFRRGRLIVKVSFLCWVGSHDTCGCLLSCPCGCHDAHILNVMSVVTRTTPREIVPTEDL
jgi:hypothetical protein